MTGFQRVAWNLAFSPRGLWLYSSLYSAPPPPALMHCARDGTGRRPLRRPPDSRVPSRAQHPRRWPPLPACSSHRTAPARAAASPAPPLLPSLACAPQLPAQRLLPRPRCRSSCRSCLSRLTAGLRATAASAPAGLRADGPTARTRRSRRSAPLTACARERRSWTGWGTDWLVSRWVLDWLGVEYYSTSRV
jgi:hypothetical protein